jgi:hypothetical protein
MVTRTGTCCLRATVDTVLCSGVGNIFREERLREKKKIYNIFVVEFLVIFDQKFSPSGTCIISVIFYFLRLKMRFVT